VSIVLTRREASFRVIEDDGRTSGAGLREAAGCGMRRVALVDGRLTVESSPGSGTMLSIEVPAG
jgi:signal transduction histidine kinase